MASPEEPAHEIVGNDELTAVPPKASSTRNDKKARKRVAWTAFEENAVARGFAKYGMLKNPWSQILADPELSETLQLRSNVDIKDKWRNMKKAGDSGRPPAAGLNEDELSPQTRELRRQREEEVRAQKKSKRSASSGGGGAAAPSNLRRRSSKANMDSVYVIYREPQFKNTSQQPIKAAKLAEAIEAFESERATLVSTAFSTARQANEAMEQEFESNLKEAYAEDIRWANLLCLCCFAFVFSFA
jgi:hypothetical protein